MVKRGKKYKANASLLDREQEYNIDDAIDILKKMSNYNFNESIDLSMSIKKPTSKIYTTLPHGNGRKIRVLLISRDLENDENTRKKFLVDFVGGEDLIGQIEKGLVSLDYDYVITTPDMINSIKIIARILGPKKLMPSIKDGTIGDNILEMARNLRNGKICLKSSKNGSISVSLGRKSFPSMHIRENLINVFRSVIKSKTGPSSTNYVKSMNISTTMGPSISINFNNLK